MLFYILANIGILSKLPNYIYEPDITDKLFI